MPKASSGADKAAKNKKAKAMLKKFKKDRMNATDDDNFDTYDDEDINDLSTIDDEESSFRSNVTTDDINYEISRQYNPVFTGGANVIREVAHSFVDDTDFFQNARKGRRTSYSLT